MKRLLLGSLYMLNWIFRVKGNNC